MPTTVPCASGVADDCRKHIPLGAVSARDPDAAALCGPCDYHLLMAKRLRFENGETVDADEEPDDADDEDEEEEEDLEE